MTDFNITFSPTLVTPTGSPTTGLYNQAGVWVDAVYFDTAGAAHFTNIVSNGNATSASATINFTTVNAGKVYLIVSSGASTATDPIAAQISQQSDITIANAQLYNWRFDSVELTLSGGPNDDANLTSVVGFGLPMQLSDTNGSVGYNVNGQEIFNQIQAINSTSTSLVLPFTAGPLAGTPRYGVSPTSASQVADPPFLPAYWNDYIDRFETTGAPTLQLAGFYNGSPDANGIWHNQGFYNYDLSYDGANFWLSPEPNSQIKGYIKISPTELANSIYATDANVEVYTKKTDATPYTIFNPGTTSPASAMNVGANNQWGNVLKELFTGFTAGFWGGSGTSLNSAVTSPIALNQNWNWDPTYAFNSNIVGSTQIYYDQYAKIFFANTNSYGSGYSDNLMALYQTGGPLLLVSNPAGGDVQELNLTVFADSDTPTGYTTPTIYNYIAPPVGGTYALPPQANSGSINMAFNFADPAAAVGDTSWMLDDTKAQVTLKVLTGYSGSTPQWTPITLVATASTVGGPKSLWWNWTVTANGDGTFSAAPAPGSAQATGSIVITGMPIVNGGTTWYQVDVGNVDGTATKTFNLYTTTVADPTLSPGTGTLVTSSGYGFTVTPGSQAVDGGASIAMGAPANGHTTDPSVKVNFMAGDSVFIDPSLLVMAPQPDGTAIPMLGTPSAPIAGTLAGTVFTALPGQTYSSPTAIAATSTTGAVSIGWIGLAPVTVTQPQPGPINGAPVNPNYNSTGGVTGTGWDSVYTNKISALDYAVVSFVPTTGTVVIAPTAGRADIDGQWHTPGVALGNQTYTVTMQEFSDVSSTGKPVGNPVGNPSSPLTLTIDAPTLAVAVTGASNNAVGFSSSIPAGATGSWIRFDQLPTTSTLAHGASLLLYATDSAGALVGRDGQTGAGVTLEQATLTAIGSTLSDSGAALFATGVGQSVYLPAGEQLHFAVLNSDGTVNLSPGVSILPQPDGSLRLSVGGFGLSAVGDNGLSDSANLASGQRSTGAPMVYLTHGSTVNVEVAGSSANTNTVGFVRMDVDPATGAWSVGGVAYGDTPAFTSAVRHDLDTGFSLTAGGRAYDQTTDWTVAGASGFYAPVMLSQNGDTFVIGNANIDGMQHIKVFGENVFGIEDLTAGQGSDFDFNDMVVKLTPHP